MSGLTPDQEVRDQVFQQPKPLQNAGGKAIKGGVVTAISQASRFAFYMASTVVLARLLSKEDFGLVAMVGALTSFLTLFREAGLSTATTQKEHITQAQVSNLFWINVLLGLLATLTGFAMAPVLAWYFGDPRLIPITRFLSLSFLCSGSSVQHMALINRSLRFKAQATINISSTLLGSIVGIVSAWRGLGYWALVYSQLSMALVEMVLCWSISGWRPQLPARKKGTRSLLSFGASLTLSSFLRKLTGNADTLIIGRLWGADSLGIYSRGMSLLMRPLDQFIIPFDIVFVPILSRLRGESDRYRTAYLEVFRAVALISFPIAGLLLGLSKQLVLIMLGSKWSSVIPVFAGLSVASLYYPLLCTTVWLPTTQGRNKDIVLLGAIISGVPLLSYCLGIPFGIVGIAWSYAIVGCLVRMPLQFHITGRAGIVTTGDLWRNFLAFVPLWIGVGITSWGIQFLMTNSSLWSTTIISGIGGLIVAVLIIIIVPIQRESARKLTLRIRESIKPTHATHHLMAS